MFFVVFVFVFVLIVVVVSQAYTPVRSYPIVYVIYVTFLVHKLYLNQVIKKKKKTQSRTQRNLNELKSKVNE